MTPKILPINSRIRITRQVDKNYLKEGRILEYLGHIEKYGDLYEVHVFWNLESLGVYKYFMFEMKEIAAYTPVNSNEIVP